MLSGQAGEPRPEHGFARAAVVGAGLMGSRLAGILAAGGLSVELTDLRADLLGPGAATAAHLAASLAAAAGTTPGPVRAEADLSAAVRHADLVVEAIIENLAAKQDLFARLDAATPDAVLATNTSVLPVREVAAKATHRHRIIGTHWWNPPDLIPVVEVVPCADTSQPTTDRVIALLTALGKEPVLVRRDVPGFIGNRLQHALWREAIALVAEGVADAPTVDRVVRNTIGLRLATMGPLENADYVGLDLTLAIHEAVLPGLNQSGQPSPLLAELVAAGHLGAKTGSGFGSWPPGARDAVAQRLSEHVTAQLRARREERNRHDIQLAD
jgi:3-hydroxybutyryl-CoA dehydrogenase